MMSLSPFEIPQLKFRTPRIPDMPILAAPLLEQ